ncbi:MAG: hypothetical protein F9K40_22660, partial [Kofleriaceae bacterium]
MGESGSMAPVSTGGKHVRRRRLRQPQLHGPDVPAEHDDAGPGGHDDHQPALPAPALRHRALARSPRARGRSAARPQVRAALLPRAELPAPPLRHRDARLLDALEGDAGRDARDDLSARVRLPRARRHRVRRRHRDARTHEQLHLAGGGAALQRLQPHAERVHRLRRAHLGLPGALPEGLERRAGTPRLDRHPRLHDRVGRPGRDLRALGARGDAAAELRTAVVVVGRAAAVRHARPDAEAARVASEEDPMRRVVPWLLLAACGGGADDGPADRPMTFGGDRPVQLQVPSDFAEDRTYPVVMILHGYGANGFIQQTFLGLADLASTHDVLVLAPDGTVDGTGKQFWNAGASWCDVTACPDDVAYLGGVLDDVLATWPVDPARVSLVGHSNGHFMSYRMMCDRADVVTAIAGLAGLGPVDPCAPSQPVHALHMHGTADAVVPYDGGAWGGATVPSAVESVAQ